jgi:hypothetical protein
MTMPYTPDELRAQVVEAALQALERPSQETVETLWRIAADAASPGEQATHPELAREARLQLLAQVVAMFAQALAAPEVPDSEL